MIVPAAGSPPELRVPNVKTLPNTAGSLATVRALVAAFGVQDLPTIMAHFAPDAAFCDIQGPGQRGRVHRGRRAIEAAFKRQFDLLGPHTYENATLTANQDFGFAAWTLVLGERAAPSSQRFNGIDHFQFDDQGRVTLKESWLKDHARLRWRTLTCRPLQVLRHIPYVVLGG